MRIWDIPPERLCRQHLLGEHRELHAIWTILTKNRKGYARHPETMRWKGKLKALYRVHEDLVAEMKKRGYRHDSPLDDVPARSKGKQEEFIDTPEDQVKILRNKKCGCRV
ncbi:MAG TPA: pyrimidine dimer DNA glycosylase/endonuclease V [Thermodesulfovibrionales bacterium]|nr:pyrimidine dimer DNA glycosylase/endonuclease V [Thermodesulfovibrionales bacterium]